VSSAFAGLLCAQDDIDFSKWVQWEHAALVIGHVLLMPINRQGEILHQKTLAVCQILFSCLTIIEKK